MVVMLTIMIMVMAIGLMMVILLDAIANFEKCVLGWDGMR